MNIQSKSKGIGFDFCVFLNYDSGSDVQLYELGSYKCIPNYSYGPCIRTRGIIHYVISGSGILQIGGHEYPVHADQLFYIPSGVKAFYKADRDDPWHYTWAHIGGRVTNELLREINLSGSNPVCDILPLSDGSNRDFSELIKDIFYGYKNEYFCIGKLYEIFDYLRISLGSNEESEENLQLRYVRNVIKYIHLKYSERIKVEDIADALNLSRSYISRLFHDATGSTIQDFLIDYRMKTAQDLLKNPCNTIQYIADAVGYNDVFTFSKAFKKKTGKTPSDFRN